MLEFMPGLTLLVGCGSVGAEVCVGALCDGADALCWMGAMLGEFSAQAKKLGRVLPSGPSWFPVPRLRRWPC